MDPEDTQVREKKGRRVPLTRARERLLRRISSRRGREAEGVALLEGPRVITTALQNGASIEFVLTESGGSGRGHAEVVDSLAERGIEVVEVNRLAMEEFAGTESPQGLLAVARQPVHELPTSPTRDVSFLLVLDGIQEPGNVGALVRVAAAFDLERVLVLDGTADPWSARAVRAAAGLTFAVPVHSLDWAEAKGWLERAGIPLLVAEGAGEDVRDWRISGRSAGSGGGGREEGWALLLGNEGRGPRAEALEVASGRIAVPVRAGVESLNVATAGAVLAWALGPGAADS